MVRTENDRGERDSRDSRGVDVRGRLPEDRLSMREERSSTRSAGDESSGGEVGWKKMMIGATYLGDSGLRHDCEGIGVDGGEVDVGKCG